MPDIEALKTLLPIVENAEGPLDDEIMADLWCAFKDIPFAALLNNIDDKGVLIAWHGKDDNSKWLSPRFDSNLQAIDDLCREVLSNHFRESSRLKDGCECYLFRHLSENISLGIHPTSEPLAILAALMKAEIAEGEG